GGEVQHLAWPLLTGVTWRPGTAPRITPKAPPVPIRYGRAAGGDRRAGALHRVAWFFQMMQRGGALPAAAGSATAPTACGLVWGPVTAVGAQVGRREVMLLTAGASIILQLYDFLGFYLFARFML